MFSKINNFKMNRESMNDKDRKEGAARIMMELMKGLGEDVSMEDLKI
jgi:hypothetical protein